MDLSFQKTCQLWFLFISTFYLYTFKKSNAVARKAFLGLNFSHLLWQMEAIELILFIVPEVSYSIVLPVPGVYSISSAHQARLDCAEDFFPPPSFTALSSRHGGKKNHSIPLYSFYMNIFHRSGSPVVLVALLQFYGKSHYKIKEWMVRELQTS